MPNLFDKIITTRSGERQLINYDFVDMTGGVVYIKFRGGTGQTSAGVTYYVMNPFDFHTKDRYTRSTGTATGVRINVTFKTLFKNSTLIGGKAILNFMLLIDCDGGGGTNSTYDVDISVLKNSTVIATGNLSDYGGVFGLAPNLHDYAVPINMALDLPKTSFIPDDELGVKIVVTSNAGNALVNLDLFHDPDNNEDARVEAELTNSFTTANFFIPIVPEV
jgi:hypothetical protein